MLEVNVMFDLVEVKQELEKMAKRLADIRGSL
ncbi:cell division protein ZapA (FtsZ GTPase activity inhibitor) [Anoxybacillus voinovskiensis]|uniref:Cell division protein ZapA (FtsZ GTPase activity inhibitor) n=1 Tax=Anoxybacteroides voinovskiense TaxID=230470 RepID=A0A840DW27_9BACL|nr:cell division protein ZapA (FtsZ GTPase activity inhibitor) [Anoxybacillus voinovskiensis]